jgi:hypothetical protein
MLSSFGLVLVAEILRLDWSWQKLGRGLLRVAAASSLHQASNRAGPQAPGTPKPPPRRPGLPSDARQGELSQVTTACAGRRCPLPQPGLLLQASVLEAFASTGKGGGGVARPPPASRLPPPASRLQSKSRAGERPELRCSLRASRNWGLCAAGQVHLVPRG